MFNVWRPEVWLFILFWWIKNKNTQYLSTQINNKTWNLLRLKLDINAAKRIVCQQLYTNTSFYQELSNLKSTALAHVSLTSTKIKIWKMTVNSLNLFRLTSTKWEWNIECFLDGWLQLLVLVSFSKKCLRISDHYIQMRKWHFKGKVIYCQMSNNSFSDKKFKNGDITFIIGIDLSLKFLSWWFDVLFRGKCKVKIDQFYCCQLLIIVLFLV